MPAVLAVGQVWDDRIVFGRETEPLQIWTVGHGRRPLDEFLENLEQNQIESVVDVRTTPGSVWAPQYNSRPLKDSLTVAGFSYVPMGKELGGRPPESQFYDEDGYVLYRRVARSDRFMSGIARLEVGARQFRIAILCSETDPAKCHRNLLIGRVMRAQGHGVTHILPAGQTEAFDDQLISVVGLPGFEEDQWRSLVQVRQGQTRSNSFDG